MTTEQNLNDRVILTREKLKGYNWSQRDVLENQLAMMDYLRELGSKVDQNILQTEYIVEIADEVAGAIGDADIFIVEEEEDFIV